MLDTVRAYAAERLEEAGETGALRARHARWFLDLVERAEPLLRTGAQLRALELLSAERENINAALRWAQGPIDTHFGGVRYLFLRGG